MKFKNTGDPDVIEARTTTSPIMLIIGLPLLLMGMIIISAPFIPAEVRGGDPIPWFIGLIGGGLFLTIGALFVFTRRSIRIDRRNGIFGECFAILFPLKRTIHKLNEFKHLQIKMASGGRSNLASRGKTQVSYDVDLVGTHSRTFDVCGTKEEAIAEAERLSQFLHLDVHDRSDTGLSVRKAGTMGETLKERLQRLQLGVELPKPLDELQSEIRTMDDLVRVDLPAQYYSNGPITLLILMGTLVYTLRLEEEWPKWAEGLAKLSGGWLANRTTFTFTGILLTLILPGLFLVLSRKRMSVLLKASSISLKIKRPFLTRITEIPFDELEDLHVTNGGSIYARSDKHSFTFGKIVSRPESEYICAMIKSRIAAS